MDGTKLITIHNPIASDNGNLELALYGSFLPGSLSRGLLAQTIAQAWILHTQYNFAGCLNIDDLYFEYIVCKTCTTAQLVNIVPWSV